LVCGTHCPAVHSPDDKHRQPLLALVQTPCAVPPMDEQQGVAEEQSALFRHWVPQKLPPSVPATHAWVLAQQVLSQTRAAGQQALAMHCPPSAQQTPLQSATGHVDGVLLLQATASAAKPRTT
jgi:hypothetical protein